jgi:hypothetical protein
VALEHARIYMAAWGTACLIALVLAIFRWKTLAVSRRAYWIGLSRRWKLLTFAVAFVGIVIIAPRTGDPTWDHWDAAFMAVLTYVTAPWTLGVVVRALLRRREKRDSRLRLERYASRFSEVFVAACVWLFSASFSYDLYIFVRDHVYPRSWSANLVVSSALYACGGAMWSLRGRATPRAITFAFLRDDWPSSLADGDVRPLLPYIGLFMVAVLAVLSPFLWQALRT